MRQLLSKLLAGGLSAAVVLLWYPQFFPSDSVESWLIRGVVWTFSFELMLLAFGPFEEALWETRGGRALYRWLRIRLRVSDGSARSQLRGRSALAGAMLTVPIALLLFAPPQVVKHDESTAATPPVTHVTEIKRIVKVQRTSAPATQAGTPATASRAGRSTAPNYEGDRASSSKTSSRGSASTPPGSDAPTTTETPTAGEPETGSETGSDVVDTPTAETPAPAPAAPATGSGSGESSAAPRVDIAA